MAVLGEGQIVSALETVVKVKSDDVTVEKTSLVPSVCHRWRLQSNFCRAIFDFPDYDAVACGS
jgi:hypothetical protein